jgi:hypothetical protein
MDGHLVSKPASKAEIELGSSVDSGTPEEAGVLASLRGRLAKQAEEIRKGGGARDLIIPSLMLSRTTCRPSRNSWRCPGSPSSRSWGLSTRDFQFFVFKLVSCDEKLLQLLLNRLREIPDIAQTLLRVRARRGTANRRSFRWAFPLLFCSIRKPPMMRQVRTTPGKVAASWITMMSRGSPSSALVDGTSPVISLTWSKSPARQRIWQTIQTMLVLVISGLPTIRLTPDAHQRTVFAVNGVLARARDSRNRGKRCLAILQRRALVVGVGRRIGSDDQKIFARI